MAKTQVRSGQIKNIDLLVEDFKDFGVVDAGGLNVTVKAGRIRDDNTITDKADQALSLTDNATNFIEITTSGVASANTSAFTSGSLPLAQVVTAAADISTITDKRAWFHTGAGGGTTPGTLSSTTKSNWLSLMSRTIVEDQTSVRAANEDGDLRTDVFSDSSGIDNSLSSDFTRRGSPNFDVIKTVVTSAALFRPGDTTSGLQGFWKLDETSGTRVDSSGNGNDLTDNNTVGSSDDDYWNTSEKSADFEGSNSEFLSITDASQTGLDLNSTDISMCAWYKQESAFGLTNKDIINKFSTTGYFFGIDQNGKLRIRFEGTQSITTNAVISIGKWHHVAMTFDDTSNLVVFYVDGNVVEVFTNTATITDVAHAFHIGANNVGNGNFLDGLLKDVAVWNTKLTSLQIKSLALGIDLSTTTKRPDAIESSNLQGYWKLNEIADGSTTRADSSGNGNTLTDNNSVLTGAGYIEGAGADFEEDNGEFLSITDASQTGLDITSDITIAGWIKVETFTGDQTLLTKWDTPSNERAYGLLIGDNGSINLILSTDGDVTDLNFSGGVGKVVPGTWAHIAATWNDTTDVATLYIDGESVGTDSSFTGPIFNSNQDVRLGVINSALQNETDGLMADVAIWNKALTSTQIKSLAAGLSLQQEGIISYWKLNETSGTRVDSIGSNDLTDNATVLSGTGQVGNAADFEASNSEFLSITDASQSGLDLTLDFTIMAWYKPESDGIIQEVLVKGIDSSSYSMRRNASRTYSLTCANIVTVGTSTIVAGTFSHVVVRVDGAAHKVWVNSVNEKTTVSTARASDVATDFKIGKQDVASVFADGLIDEVVVAARYFREEEIKAAYNKGLNGKEVTSFEVSLAGADAVVISTSFSLSETPTRALITSNKTLNTGTIILYASRVSSPGSTLTDVTKWTPITADTITDITGQDSGSTGRWGAAITGDAELDDIAVVLGKAVV